MGAFYHLFGLARKGFFIPGGYDRAESGGGMASICFEKNGMEWSAEQNQQTIDFFENFDKQQHVLWEIEVKHVSGTPECIAVVGDHMKAWVEQALTNYLYNSENPPSALERFWINHDVEATGTGFQIFLFTYSSFFPFFGVKDPVFYKAYRTVEEFIDDGWAVV